MDEIILLRNLTRDVYATLENMEDSSDDERNDMIFGAICVAWSRGFEYGRKKEEE